MSVTGVLLTYERQITAWADGYALSPAAGAARIGVEALASRVHETHGAWPTAITLRADPSAPAELAIGREGTVFVDPYTGSVLGRGSIAARRFFRAVTDWHRWLGASGEARAGARAVTGAANLAFLFIVLSGIYLWWPARLTPQHLRPITRFGHGLRGRARDFNWHNTFGFWSAVPLAFIVASGVVISYPWANDLLYTIAGGEPPRRGGPARGGAGPAPQPTPSLVGLDRAWGAAEAQVPGWQSLSLRVPSQPEEPWSFTADTATGRRPHTRTQFTLDRATAATLRVEDYAAAPGGRKAFLWMRFLHTGEAFGAVGQTVAGTASASAVLLAWTGVSLSLRRFAAWRRRRARPPAA
jgi:uncharacterized iron-regulated membrane protein